MGFNAESTHPQYPNSEFLGPYKPRRRFTEELPEIYSRKTQILPEQPMPDFRANNPHTLRCNVLSSNVRTLCEPICDVYSAATHPEQQRWWPPAEPPRQLEPSSYTLDTTYRDDFVRKRPQRPPGATRHSSNPNTEPALGAVPVNFMAAADGKPRVFKEGISYEHIYDSRKDPNYPIRAKRQGAFVWDQVTPRRADNFLEYMSWLKKQESYRQSASPRKKSSRTSSISSSNSSVKRAIPEGYTVYPAEREDVVINFRPPLTPPNPETNVLGTDVQAKDSHPSVSNPVVKESAKETGTQDVSNGNGKVDSTEENSDVAK